MPEQLSVWEQARIYLTGTYKLPYVKLLHAPPPLAWQEATKLAVQQGAGTATCGPKLPDTTGFTEAQLYDTYSPYVDKNGSQEAKDALKKGEQVIVGLRIETNTRTNSGKGAYDDRMAIIWQEEQKPQGAVPLRPLAPLHGRIIAPPNGLVPAGPGTAAPVTVKHGADFKANTEPTAQYEDPGPLEIKNPKTGKTIRIVQHANHIIGPDGKAIKLRKIEGNDVDGDGRVDLGRLAPGTYTFYQGKDYLKHAALRPRGMQTVEWDINHDGSFTHDDMWHTDKGDVVVETGNFAVLIHYGNEPNTDSAGCQTLPPKEHARFFEKLRKKQKDFYYVLVTLK